MASIPRLLTLVHMRSCLYECVPNYDHTTIIRRRYSLRKSAETMWGCFTHNNNDQADDYYYHHNDDSQIHSDIIYILYKIYTHKSMWMWTHEGISTICTCYIYIYLHSTHTLSHTYVQKYVYVFEKNSYFVVLATLAGKIQIPIRWADDFSVFFGSRPRYHISPLLQFSKVLEC